MNTTVNWQSAQEINKSLIEELRRRSLSRLTGSLPDAKTFLKVGTCTRFAKILPNEALGGFTKYARRQNWENVRGLHALAPGFLRTKSASWNSINEGAGF